MKTIKKVCSLLSILLLCGCSLVIKEKEFTFNKLVITLDNTFVKTEDSEKENYVIFNSTENLNIEVYFQSFKTCNDIYNHLKEKYELTSLNNPLVQKHQGTIQYEYFEVFTYEVKSDYRTYIYGLVYHDYGFVFNSSDAKESDGSYGDGYKSKTDKIVHYLETIKIRP